MVANNSKRGDYLSGSRRNNFRLFFRQWPKTKNSIAIAKQRHQCRLANYVTR